MAEGQLFAGKKLWFSQQVPQRNWLIENAKAHGAVVTRLEQQADVILVDHTKKGHAPGTYSYRFVELSIRKGQLEDLSNHTVGSVVRAERPVGSIKTAAKGTRTIFTEADNQLLWNWVKPYENLSGTTRGNEIYKQLERYNNRHTFQSWRDHWIKHTQYQTTRQITSEIGPAYEAEDEEIRQAALNLPRTSTPQEDTNGLRRTIQLDGTSDDGVTKNSRSVTQRSEELSMGANQSNVTTNTTESTDAHPKSGQAVTGLSARSNIERETNKKLEGEGTTKEKGKALASTLENTHVLPLAYDFTQEIAHRLYKAVPHILNSDSSAVLDRLWDRFIHHYPGYGDQKRWVSYFETYIYPIWLKLEGLDPKDKDEIDNRVRMHLQVYQIKCTERAARNATKRDAEASELQPGIPESQITDAVAEDDRQIPQSQNRKPASECANCFTTKTHRWRRDVKGRDLCDACGRFLKENGVMRPSSTWTEPPDASDVEDQSRDGDDSDDSDDEEEEEEETLQKDHDDVIAPVKVGPAIEQSTSPLIERPPGPNESRKRSHGRSTQSDSQSQSKSQTTTNSGSISDIPYSAEPAEDVQQHELSLINQKSAGSPKRSASWSDDSIINPKRRKLSPSSGDQEQNSSSVSIMSLPSDSGSESDGEDEQEDSLFGSPELGAVGSNTRSRGHDDSPLFIAQDSDEDISDMEPDVLAESSQNDSEADDPNVEENGQDGSRSLNLFDEEDADQDMAEISSEYAASEAPSEGVHFDDTPQLSQAWDTAPKPSTVDEDDGGRVAKQNELDDSYQFQQVTRSSSAGAPEASGENIQETTTIQEVDESVPLSLEDDVEGIEDETFETAREKFPADLTPTSPTNNDDNAVGQISKINRLETQALFQQSLPNVLTDDLFFIPPPDDWESDPEFEVINENAIDPSKSKLVTIKEEANDPAPTHVNETSQNPSDSSDEDDPEKIDQFILDQKQLYSARKLNEEIIEAIAIRALESTSLRIDLASYVVEAMVRTYTKSQDRGNSNGTSSNGFDGSFSSSSDATPTPTPVSMTKHSAPKLQPKQIDQLVETLLPVDMQGVWTTRDDEMLYGSDGRLIKRVNDKHGDEALEARLGYLAEMHHHER